MGTNIYGRYDELVIEFRGRARLQAGRRSIRVKVDDVWRVRAAAPATLVSWAGEQVLCTRGRSGAPMLVLELVDGAPYDRLVLGVPEAEAMAAGFQRSGIGAVADEGVLVG